MSDFDIVPGHLAVKAMRDNGYKNAAYALAELMDNSVQAGAKNVSLLCLESQSPADSRLRSRIDQIAVLDDGEGMDAKVLRIALQFGNGTRLTSGLEDGIGRFGMGLPGASVSQCQRVDVWSWRNGAAKALHTYLDLNEIAQGRMKVVPEPDKSPIPPVWLQASGDVGKSGTLVVWSKIDRCIWRTARAIIENSEFIVGRMYRRFIQDGKVRIRLLGFDKDHPGTPNIDQDAKANDPLYLTSQTSTPEPWANSPMFQEWGAEDSNTVTIRFRGKDHKVKLRFSYAKEAAREVRNAGDLPHGRHAKRNIGLSIMRAGRELELDMSWARQGDPVERFWGAEVDFQPGLDDLFGVTNNKQHAHHFSNLGALDLDALAGDRTIAEVAKEMEEDGDPRGPLLELKKRIETNISAMRRLLTAQTKGRDRSRRHSGTSPEKHGTDVTRARQAQGFKGASDEGEKLPPEKKVEEIKNTLKEQGVTEEQASALAATTVEVGLKYLFATADLETSAFFSVKYRGGSLVLLLNSNHPAYEHLVETLDREDDDDATGPVEALTARLAKARDGLKLLLEAWARYEDEQPDGPRRKQAQDARHDWGRMAESFLGKES